MATGCTEGKKSRERPRIIYLANLSTWITECVPHGQAEDLKELYLLKKRKGTKLWRGTIVHILKGHGREEVPPSASGHTIIAKSPWNTD